MFRQTLSFCVAIGIFLEIGNSPVLAEHAKITLDVTTSKGQETAFVDQTPPPSGKNPRPVVKAKVGEPIKVQFMLTNVYPHKTLENVVVHFFVAKQEKVGQKDLPDLQGEVVTETAFEMDFKPSRPLLGDRSGGRGVRSTRLGSFGCGGARTAAGFGLCVSFGERWA